jgi:hypothetical protein
MTIITVRPRCLRPSLGDSRFKGDAWIADEGDGTLAMRLGNYCLAEIAGLALDVPTLNQLFDKLRRRHDQHQGRRPRG